MVDCRIEMIADDANIVKAINGEKDTAKFEQHIDHLHMWADMYKMRFTCGKCEVLHLGDHNPRHDCVNNYTISEEVSEEKYLGVVLDYSEMS